MKKTLSVVLTSAMALSMFSSLAFAAKSSTDFTDLKDLDAATKAKFDAMISAGIFDGVSETTFGLKDEMNRAQFAKVAALIMGLDVNKDLKTSSFTDVSVDDSANGYALPYIEALKTAGVTDGYAEGQYNPAGKVTKEQLATFLVRVLGQDEAAKGKTGTDTTVSGWAQGYVALALELKLLTNGEDGTFGGQANATRDLLLTGAYEAKQQYVPAGKVSVTGAKATGAQQVTVTFNKPVDVEKAKLSLKKGTSDVVTTTKFADDKKSAVLTLSDVKVSKGEYTVTVSGLDAATVEKTSATFTGEDEVLTKIDFVSANDTIAYADKVIVKAKAVNQYGEAASTNAGSYDVYTSAATFTKITKDNDGTLLITLDTVTDGTTQGVSVIPVTIVNNDSHITATKNFKLGTQPILTKLELGAARYSAGTALNGKGENAEFDLNLYDQYGSVMSYEMLSSADKLKDTSLIWNDYLATEDVSYEIEDNGNDIPQVKISLLNDIDKSGDFGFTVFNQAATATGKVSIQSAKVATKLEIGDMNDVIASGDTDVYVPLVAYDAQGKQLSADDLASDANVDRIKVSISGATGGTTIEASGEHKGMIKLNTIDAGSKGAVSVTAVIATANASSTATKTYTVHDARIADHFKEVTVAGKNAVAGASSDFEFNVIDQYGQVLDDSNYVNSNGSAVTTADGNTKYSVIVTAVTYDADGKEIANGDAHVVAPDNSVINGPVTYEKGTKDFKAFNDEFTFETTKNAKAGSYVKFTAQILKGDKEISKVERKLTVVGQDADLTYSVGTVAPLFNAMDSDLVNAEQLKVATSKLSREVKISAKNAAGEVVELPGVVTQITSSNTNVAQVAIGTSEDAGKAFVLGNQAGTATLNVAYQTVKGEVKQVSVPVTVKEDVLAVDKLEAGETEATISSGANAYVVADLTVTDNYGVEYDKEEAPVYNYMMGLTFSTDNVKGKVAIGTDGTITADANSTFDLIITSPNGKSTVTAVTVK